MKGFNDFIKETNTPENLFPILSKIFSESEYSLELVLKDLKNSFKTILKEEKLKGRYNDTDDVLGFYDLNNKRYSWFGIHESDKVIDILYRIKQELKKVPIQNYLESSEYREEKELRDARTRVSGFKDFGDMTRAYYEK